MTIPLWFLWVVAIAVAAGALRRGDAPSRNWLPAVLVLAGVAWLTVDHVVVSQGELDEATADAAASLDGATGGISQDRLRIAVEDRLGRAVHVTRRTATPEDPSALAYDLQVTVGDGDDDGGLRSCVRVVENRVDPEAPGVRVTSTAADAGGCGEDKS